MSVSYGACICCKKTIGYEEINLCKDCENNYIELIKKYVKTNGYKVTSEELHEKLGIPYKAIGYFQTKGFLEKIENNEDITEEEKPKKDDRIEKLNALKNSLEESKNQKPQPENKVTGPRMHTRY